MSIAGNKKMETYLDYLVWIVFSYIYDRNFIKENYAKIFRTLAFLLSICFTIFISCAAISYFETRNITHFFYFDLLSPLDLHPIYLSLLILFTIIQLTLKNIVLPIRNEIGLIFILQLFLVMLSSKTIIGLNIAFYIFLIFKLENKRYKYFSILMIIASAIVILNTPYINDRFSEILNTKAISILSKERIDDWSNVNGLTMRLFIQKNALLEQYQNQKMIFGIGAGNSIGFLNKLNEIHNLAITYPNGLKQGLYNYNMHSQYLQIILNFGIIGFLLFTFVIINLCKSKSEYNLSINLCLIIFIIAFFTESYLETFRGIHYFMFIYCLKKQLSYD